MSGQSLSMRRIVFLGLPIVAALIVFGVNGSWRSSADVPGFTLVVILGLVYLMVFAAAFSSFHRGHQSVLRPALNGVRADAATSMGLGVDNAVPGDGSPAKVAVVGSADTCPIGLTTGYRVKVDPEGNLSEPLCRGAVDAISGTARARLEDRDVSTACACPLGPQRLWFAYKESV